MTNILEAAGNVLATVRSGNWSLTWQIRRAYDTAGLVTAETNALGGVTTYSGYNVTRTRTYIYCTDYSTNLTLVSMTMTTTSGLKSWNTVYRDGSTPSPH